MHKHIDVDKQALVQHIDQRDTEEYQQGYRAAKIAKTSGCDYEPELLELYDEDKEIRLTVNEAKNLMRILHENAPYLDCLYESSKDDYLFLQEITERIEQR